MGKRVRRSLSNLWAIAIALFGIFAVAVPTYSQTSQPAAKTAIVEEIEEYAERHVDNDTSMQTKVILDLYRDNQVGLTPKNIAEIYETEYIRLKKAKESNLWERLNPTGGWIVAFVLGVLLLFRDVLQEWANNFVKAIGLWVYHRFAGTPLFHKFSLKRYRQALLKKYQKLDVPFRPDRPLQMREVYVPLKVAGSSDPQQIDADRAVADYHKLMVIGPPGSGKSMLLKYLALNYAEDRLLGLPEQPIAIFLELHRLSDPEKSLKQHLVEALDRDHFPKAERFVSQGLERGRLMLLLDGLDEVNSSERPRVIQEIRDLLDQLDDYQHRCRVIITCRTAIYQGEFDDRVDRKLEVVEFQDRQIRQFLEPWASDMPENKSIEHLMQTLSARPRIMALARNPLLLTIIAYLYTDTPFVLPHSRADFYQKATDILLDMWHQEHNCYKAREKRSVLQHLALYFQDNADRQQQDRRSVNYRQVLAEVTTLLPELNVNSEDTQPLLQEIVERSGLLLEIDGGDRYQFAHLTLQEYFAAAALRENGAQLVERFKKDPEAWRETVKLWCGLAADSTKAIESIYEQDPMTAFECLADAQKVNQELATKIIESFQQQLSQANKDDQIIRAFAAVAADKRPRGQATFQFLEETLVNQDPASRSAAAQALSLTNLPDAALVLANHYNERSPEIREHLVQMGDLAVPSLANLSAKGSQTAMDGLWAIATPDAAKALVPLLWNSDENLAVRAAWRLASLLPQPNIEDGLRDYPIAEGRQKKWLDWIWEPFEEPGNSALPIIAGRIAYLISEVPFELNDTESLAYLDPRLIVPICAIEKRGEIDITALQQFKAQFDQAEKHKNIDLMILRQLQPVPVNQLVNEILSNSASSYWRNLLENQTEQRQFDLLRRLAKYGPPNINDWRNIFRPIKYEFNTGWHYRTILLLAAILSLIAVGKITFLIFYSSLFLEQVLFSILGVIIVSFLGSIVNTKEIDITSTTWKATEPEDFIEFYCLSFLLFFKNLINLKRLLNESGAFIYTIFGLYIMLCLGVLFLIGSIIGQLGNLFFGIEIVPMWFGIAFEVIGFGLLLFSFFLWQLEETILLDKITWIMLSVALLCQCVSFALIIENGGLSVALLLLFYGILYYFLTGIVFDWWESIEFWKDLISFPFCFCFPVVAYLVTKAILLLFSWKIAVIFWATLLGSCTVLWVIGQKREREARNPLHGIIPNPKTAENSSDKNKKKRSFALWPMRN